MILVIDWPVLKININLILIAAVIKFNFFLTPYAIKADWLNLWFYLNYFHSLLILNLKIIILVIIIITE